MFSLSAVSIFFLCLLLSTGISAEPQHHHPNPNPNTSTCNSVSVRTVTVTVSAASSSTSLPVRLASSAAPPTNTVNNNGGKGSHGGNGGGQSGSTKTTTSGNNGATGKSGAAGNNSGSSDPQSSLTLDPSVIAPGFAKANGNPAIGQANSLTSVNNFINFCLGKTITNGQQVKAGSCNPVPLGDIPSTKTMPSAKFQFPKNFGTIPANKPFTITMAINNLETGDFTNAEAAYFSAPQQLNKQGVITGHSHVVVEQIGSLKSTTLNNPNKFAFFKGLNGQAANGLLTADVTGGLPAGVYRLSSINSAANHQPVLVPVAQHGSLDDIIYFTVVDGTTSGSKGTANSTVSGNSSKNTQGPNKTKTSRMHRRSRWHFDR